MSRVCVICQGTEKVLVAACSHNYCDGCVNRELLRGAFACFVCKTPVSRNSFINRTNNSSGGGVVSLTKEMKQRRRLAKIYNRVREDFRNEEEYYLFQEQAEELAYRVVRGEDCEHEIAAYKLANGPSIVARNQENEARAREQREKDVREAEARVQREQEQQQQDRKDAVARLREREKAISNIQKGELDAREANKRVEAAMSKRRKRDEEQEAAAKEQQQQNTKKEKKNALPRPVGAVPLMANEQRAIGNSYRGQLDAAALQELYRRTACTSHGHEAVLKRARHEARMHQ